VGWSQFTNYSGSSGRARPSPHLEILSLKRGYTKQANHHGGTFLRPSLRKLGSLPSESEGHKSLLFTVLATSGATCSASYSALLLPGFDLTSTSSTCNSMRVFYRSVSLLPASGTTGILRAFWPITDRVSAWVILHLPE
jgi:hypothetical protein